MNKSPLVSVILCVYNGEKFIREAIQSVKDQEYENIEFIAINDGSTDQSLKILEEYKINKLISHRENLGIANARNRGIKESGGNYITFIDADDTWPVHKVTRQVIFHQKHPELGFSFIKQRIIIADESNKPNWTNKKAFQKDHVAYGAGGIFAKKEVFTRVGDYQPDYLGAENGEWVFRAKDMGFKFGIIDEVLLFRRVHEANVTNEVNTHLGLLLKNIKSSIDRQKSGK